MYCFFDTETTGLPAKGQYDNYEHPSTPRLVELAALLTDENGNELDSMSVIVVPDGFSIPDEAANVHGITDERALLEGIAVAKAIDIFRPLAKRATFLVAHNMQYDWLILRGELKRLKIAFPSHHRICTKELTTPICRLPARFGGFKWPNLQEAYKHFFGTNFDNAHSALADVRACKDVFFATQKL